MNQKLGFSKVFCLSMCTACEDWAPASCPRSSSPSLIKSLGLKYLQWDTDNDTRQPGRGRTDSSTGCTLFIKKVRVRWFGGKQKDREEMQRLKSASRIWVQSVNLRDPSRRRRRKGGGLWAKNTRSHGEVILPPARTHSWTTTVESKSSECTKWKENELNREEEEERFVDFLEPWHVFLLLKTNSCVWKKKRKETTTRTEHTNKQDMMKRSHWPKNWCESK